MSEATVIVIVLHELLYLLGKTFLVKENISIIFQKVLNLSVVSSMFFFLNRDTIPNRK